MVAAKDMTCDVIDLAVSKLRPYLPKSIRPSYPCAFAAHFANVSR